MRSCFQAHIYGKTVLEGNEGRHEFGRAISLSTNRCTGLQNTVKEMGWDRKHKVL